MADPVLVKTAEEIQEDIQNQIEIDTGISVRQQGHAVTSLAFAQGLENEHLAYQVFKAEINGYIKRATGSALDNHATDWGLTRRTETQATGEVTLTGSATVPVGTQYAAPATSTRDRIVFEVTTETVVSSGTPNVPVRAVVAGSAGNLASSSITEIVTEVSGISAVTNAAATSGGQDQEDDDSLRNRILAYIEGLSKGTPVSIIDGCLNFAVTSVTLTAAITNSTTVLPVSDLDLAPISDAGGKLALLDSAGNIAEIVSYAAGAVDAVNDTITVTRGVSPGPSATSHVADTVLEEYVTAGKGKTVKSATLVETPGHVDVTIDDGQTNGTDAELVTLVQNRLRGDGTARDPGYRPAGVTLNCAAASRTTVNVTATIQGTADRTKVKEAVELYLNNRKLGETVYGFEVAAVISDYPGVDNIVSGTLYVGGNQFVGTSSADVAITTTGIAYAGTVSIS